MIFHILILRKKGIKKKAIEEENAPIPDLITYSTVIKGFCRAKEMEKALDLYEFLQQPDKDFVLDEVIYNSILDGCVKTNNFEKAFEIQQEMKNHNIKLSNVTYSILVKLYTGCKDYAKAFEIYQKLYDEHNNNFNISLSGNFSLRDAYAICKNSSGSFSVSIPS